MWASTRTNYRAASISDVRKIGRCDVQGTVKQQRLTANSSRGRPARAARQPDGGTQDNDTTTRDEMTADAQSSTQLETSTQPDTSHWQHHTAQPALRERPRWRGDHGTPSTRSRGYPRRITRVPRRRHSAPQTLATWLSETRAFRGPPAPLGAVTQRPSVSLISHHAPQARTTAAPLCTYR